MRAELSDESARVFFVEAPVDQARKLFVCACRYWTPPTVVAMPVGVDLRDLPQLACLNAAQYFAIPRSIVILKSNLVVLAGALHSLANTFASFNCERHALFAVDVVSTFQYSGDVVGVERKRS